jgi:hypothetical protein
MKRGKKPPIDMKLSLSRSERLHKSVFRVGLRPHLDNGARSWINMNCMVCQHKNTERLVESALTGDEMFWKHVCIHPGPVKLIAITSPSQGINNCSGFLAEIP